MDALTREEEEILGHIEALPVERRRRLLAVAAQLQEAERAGRPR